MKIIFFGTPDFVTPILDALHKTYNHGSEKKFIAVVTQPPKMTGRDQKREFSPVDKWAFDHKLEISHNFDNLPEADLGIVAAYGNIIPGLVINHFSLGILNVHPSLLPKYRGASPIQTAIAEGAKVTGVTIMKMDKEMDHGPIVSQFKEDIKDDDTNETLRKRLFERSAEFLIELMPRYVSGKITPKEQNHKEASFTKLIKKNDGYIDPLDLIKPPDPEKINNLIRALYPWPNVWSYIDGRKIKILKSHISEGKLQLDEVQLEGKNKVTWKQFQEGHPNLRL